MHNFLENKLKGKSTHIKKRYSSRSCLNDFTITCNYAICSSHYTSSVSHLFVLVESCFMLMDITNTSLFCGATSLPLEWRAASVIPIPQ